MYKIIYYSNRCYLLVALSKANQDSYLVCESFLGPNNHFMGVFDGHGEYGDYCSHFAADQVRFIYFNTLIHLISLYECK